MFGIFMIPVLFSCSKFWNKEEVVEIGALLDLSGNYSESGLASKTAIELSLTDLNQKYALAGSGIKFMCVFEDTKMDTALAVAAVKKMYDNGIRLLVAGPNTSAELKAIKSFVDSKKMLVLNSFSTAPELSIADDYIFRLLTDDNAQGQALVKMMEFDSVKVLIPIWREDTYGTGLYQAIKKIFERAGGTVLAGASFKPASIPLNDIITTTAAQVRSANETYGKSKVGVLLIGYQESVQFLHSSNAFPDLASARWYGCDTNIQKDVIINDAVASDFALKVHFKGPIMSVGTAEFVPPTALKLMDKISELSGIYPDTYSLNSYDAVQILGQAYDIVQSYNTELIRNVLPTVCSTYNYVGLSRKLNSSGDLETANYIFWTIKPGMGKYYWETYATYVAEGDYIRIK